MEKKKYVVLILLVLILVTSFDFAFAGTYFFDIFGHWAEEDIMWGTNEVKLFKGYEDGTFKPDNYITRSEFVSILYRTATNRNVMNEALIDEIEISDKFQLDISGTSYVDEEALNDIENVNESNKQDGEVNEEKEQEEFEKKLEDEIDLIYEDLDINFWAYNDIVAVKDFIDWMNKDVSFNDIFPGNSFYPNKFITREEAALLTYFYTTPPVEDKDKRFDDLNEEYEYYDIIRSLVNNDIITGYEDNNFRPNDNITRGESAAIIKRIYMNMKYFEEDYLDDIYLISGEYIDSAPLFGDYEKIELTNDDFRYKKAISSLEYLDLVGRIPYEEKHLYDLEPLDTLNSLKENDYWNKLGIDYYILKYGELEHEEKLDIFTEILEEYMMRDDIKDFESLLIFNEGLSFKDDLKYMVPAVEKWKENSESQETKYNAIFILSKILIDLDRGEEALKMYEDDVSEEILVIKLYYTINKAYLLKNLGKLNEAKDVLIKGWDILKQDSNYHIYRQEYEDIFIGSIKKVIMIKSKMEIDSDSQI